MVDDPLVVILGVGEYYGLPNLDGIAKDYDNIINTFVRKWKYYIMYKLNTGSIVYCNDINKISDNRDYKLTWSVEEIDELLGEARKQIVTKKHNGLLVVVSGHGDRKNNLLETNGDKYHLEYVFDAFSAETREYFDDETSEQSMYLMNIPKIFLLDICRGKQRGFIRGIGIWNHNSQDSKDKVSESQMAQNVNTEENKEADKTPKVRLQKAQNVNINTNDNKEADETFTLKVIGKDEAAMAPAEMQNFSKVYATTQGCTTADGSKNGGIFLRSVCKVFNDNKFVLKNDWDRMIIKIREYTKRAATLTKLIQMTQMVEHISTMECGIQFNMK